MPHVVYLHSALTARGGGSPRRHRRDVLVSLGVASVVNGAVLLVAAAALHVPGAEPVATTIEGACHALGGATATVFAGALLLSALASACVGVHAGDAIMVGFLQRRIPVVWRRALTLLPAVAVLAAGVDLTSALVVSQVVLALGLPFALLPLIDLTRRRELMGAQVNRRGTTVVATAVAALVCVLAVTIVAAG
jgi:manganese transport protein